MSKSHDIRLSNPVDLFLGVQRVFNPCVHFKGSSSACGYRRRGFPGSFYDGVVKFSDVMTFNHGLREI